MRTVFWYSKYELVLTNLDEKGKQIRDFKLKLLGELQYAVFSGSNIFKGVRIHTFNI